MMMIAPEVSCVMVAAVSKRHPNAWIPTIALGAGCVAMGNVWSRPAMMACRMVERPPLTVVAPAEHASMGSDVVCRLIASARSAREAYVNPLPAMMGS